MTMRLNPFSPRTWTPTDIELGHSTEVRDGTVRLPRQQLPEELRQHGELMLAVIDLPDANRRILGVHDSGVDLPAAMVSPSDWGKLVPSGTGDSLRPMLRVRPLSLPERTRRLAGLSGAIVIAAVLSAVLTAIPLLLPAPDAAAKRAEAAQLEVSEVSAALTAFGSHTVDVGSAVRRASTAAAGEAHALEHRRELDGLGTGATRSGPAARRAATALRKSADLVLRDNQEVVDATRAAAANAASLQSSSTAIATWRADLRQRVKPAPAPWRDRLRVASGVMTVVAGVLAACLAWRKLAPGGSGI